MMLVTENVLVMDLNLPSWVVAPGWFVFLRFETCGPTGQQHVSPGQRPGFAIPRDG